MRPRQNQVSFPAPEDRAGWGLQDSCQWERACSAELVGQVSCVVS